jgi:beta-alanine degradation protein BauB
VEFGTYDRADFADELSAAPANHDIASSIVFENDRVRVWDLVLEPGERLPFHCHDRTYFFVTVEAGTAISRFPDGNQVTMDYAPGEPWFTEIGADHEIHDLENVGATRLRFTTVELLTR